MIGDLSLFDAASRLARHAAFNHRIIGENIAHADTPGYRARQAEPFSLDAADPFVPRTSRAGHRTDGPAAAHAVETRGVPASPNGNTVVLEDQMVRAVEAEGRHRLALTVYGKAADLLRLGLGRRA